MHRKQSLVNPDRGGALNLPLKEKVLAQHALPRTWLRRARLDDRTVELLQQLGHVRSRARAPTARPTQQGGEFTLADRPPSQSHQSPPRPRQGGTAPPWRGTVTDAAVADPPRRMAGPPRPTAGHRREP
jgi:hypothetical protein